MRGHRINVDVVDYKTGKPKTRNQILGSTKSSDGDYGRQLVFYKLLLDNFQDAKYKMVSGEIDFIEPDDRKKYHKEKFEITTEQVEKLKGVILQVANDIISLSFFGKTCDDKKCEYCKLATILKIH